MRSHPLAALPLALALLLAGCSGGEEPETPGGDESVEPPLSTSPAAVATTSEEELVVADLLREPGPYTGDDFDLEAATAAVTEAEPGSAEEWTDAIVAATHGDHAEDTQYLLDFDPTLSENPEAPTEQPRQVDGVEVVGSNHFAVVLDASGSMAEQQGGGTRMEAAKDAIRSFARRLPDGSTMSLRVYGHEGSSSQADRKESCASTEVVHEGEPQGVGRAMSRFAPTGWTPLARSIEAAGDDIPDEASDTIAYVVTDGLETCGGDPVAAAKRLAATGAEPVVNVIGFQVGNADQRQLRRIARAGGGDYTDVGSGTELERYWQADRDRMLEAWRQWREEATERINEEGRAAVEEVNARGRALSAGIDEEWDHQQLVVDALVEEDAFPDDSVRAQTWSALSTRRSTLWSWAETTRAATFSEAETERAARWVEAYDTGSEKWSDVYRRSFAQ